jgi:hypothetical protein
MVFRATTVIMRFLAAAPRAGFVTGMAGVDVNRPFQHSFSHLNAAASAEQELFPFDVMVQFQCSVAVVVL